MHTSVLTGRATSLEWISGRAHVSYSPVRPDGHTQGVINSNNAQVSTWTPDAQQLGSVERFHVSPSVLPGPLGQHPFSCPLANLDQIR